LKTKLIVLFELGKKAVAENLIQGIKAENPLKK
jgi:hypothetical protein